MKEFTNEEMKDIIIEMKPRFHSFSVIDKKNLREIAGFLDIKIGKCSNCYRDAYLEIRNKLGITVEEESKPVENSKKYRFTLPEKKTVEWHSRNGKVLLGVNTPDHIIDQFISQFPNQTYFITL